MSRVSVWIALPLNLIASPPSRLSIVPLFVIDPAPEKRTPTLVAPFEVVDEMMPELMSEPPASNSMADPPPCAFDASI